MNCQHCQPLLLDHLYGLLDGAEAAAVDVHLASCPACAAARAETARVQGLIARAAKSAFPNTKFEPPEQPKPARAPAPSAPGVLPFPAPGPARPGRTFGLAAILPWAVAAAVFLAVPGTVIPVLGMFDRAESATRDARTARLDAESASLALETAQLRRATRLTDAEVKVTAAEQTQTALLNRWVDEQKAAVKAATARKLTVDVMKPATVQPGAPNDFLLVVKDERERWEARGKLVAEVRAVGATDAVLLSQEIDHKQGDRHALRLPAEVWARVKPNTELFLVVAQVDELTKARTELQDRIRLAGPVFTTLLVTDKPTYRPGERLFFRSLTLDRVTLRPPTREQVLRYELFHPDGRPVSGLSTTGTTELARVGAEGKVEPVRATDGQPVRGVGCGEFVLPADLADGDYVLALRELPHPGGFPATVPVPATRPVKVRAGAPDHYRKEIGFAREGYAPGEAVEAWAELRFEGKPVGGAAVASVAVEADGVAVEGVTTTKATDKDGRARVRFPLPADVADGDVRLRVTFRTPGGDEAVTRRVPVVGRRLVVEFFPECGDTLVAGVPCKVYVRTTTPAGQPVPIRGVVTDGRRTLAKVASLNDPAQPGANRGLASFTYTPELGRRVWLKVESPAGSYAPIMADATVPSAAVAALGGAGAVAARTGFPLPLPEREGVVMSVPDAVTAPGQPIRVRLHSVGSTRTLVVGAYTRGRLSDTQKVTVEPGQMSEVRLMAGADPGTGGRGGVVRITAFEEVEGKDGEAKPDLRPVAERLVFRKPGELLNLALSTTPAATETQAAPALGVQTLPVAPRFGYTAGSAVNLGITATDESGNPAAAVLWAAAVNSGVAPGAKDRLLTTHFLLAGEVKNPDDLEYADFLLTDHPKAAEALDLLLGTQGWRRFVEQSPAVVPAAKPGAFVANFPGADVNRLLAHNGQYPVWAEPAPLRDHRRLYETYAPRYEAAVRAVARAKGELAATRADTSGEAAARELGGTAGAARRAADEKARRAEAAREPVLTFRANVWYGIAGFAALALCCALVSFARPAGRFPLGFSAVGSLGLAAFLVVASGWSDAARAAAPNGAEVAKLDDAAGEKEAAQPAPPASGSGRNETKSEAVTPSGGNVDTFTGGPKVKGGAKTGVGSVPPAPGTALAPAKDPVRPTAPFPPAPRLPADGFGRVPATGYAGGMGMGGYAPTLLPAPKPPGPSGPAGATPASSPPPGTPMIELSMGGGTGWTPHRSKVTLAEPGRAGLRSSGDVFYAETLKKDSERAAKFAAERTRTLTAAMDDVLVRRPRQHPAPQPPIAAGVQAAHLGKLTPADVEKIAVQRVRGTVTATPPLVVREFAAARPAPGPLPDAADWPDTVLWQPVIVLPADGKATLAFHLGDAPGGYQVVVAGHTPDGRLGAARDILRVAPRTLAPGGQGVPGGSIPPVIPVAPGSPPMP